jgi:hypothetical protein
MRVGGRILIATLLWALLLVGCGSSADPQGDLGSAPITVGQAFADRALSACASALEQKQAWPPFPVTDFDPNHPDADKLPEVGSWLQEGAGVTFATWLESLQALGQPPSAREAWADVLTSVENIKELNEQQIAAAGRGDTQAFAQATSDLGAEQPRLVRATEAAGVSACADVHA